MHLNKIVVNSNRFPTKEYYPFNLSVFQSTGSIEFSSPVTFFTGENGSGKSTLLRAISKACGIHIWGEVERTRYENNPYEDELYRAVDTEWADGSVPGSYFDSQLFRNFASMLDEWASADPAMLKYFGGKSLITQSHGQSLMSFFRSRFLIKGLYFLDEPETALSPRSQLKLLNVLNEARARGNAQFIIASHSPILLSCPMAEIYNFDTVPVSHIEYIETEHYRIYKEFMESRNNSTITRQ
ncbi:MAG: AAA family ATPase [Candidatus Latescibacteria bacterium]|nr:AAA family ATPase [Candidatus Latescibacterota bacterium]